MSSCFICTFHIDDAPLSCLSVKLTCLEQRQKQRGGFLAAILGRNETVRIARSEWRGQDVSQGASEKESGGITRANEKDKPFPFVLQTRRPQKSLFRLNLPSYQAVQSLPKRGQI